MAPSHDSELKQQGVLEAARDPNNRISAEDAERAVLNEAKKAGVEAFQFDPNATAEQKAAQARSHVPPGFHHDRKPRAVALASDTGPGTGTTYDLPSPTKEGAVALPSPTDDGKASEDAARWERVGWAPRFGQGDGAEDEGTTMLDHETWLEGKLDDRFFGDWYHNTGIIIFACLASWIVAVLGGGLGWVIIIMTFCGTYYRTSLRRVRRNFRDDLSREMAKARLETDSETLEWINSFLVKFWPIYAPVLCATIVSSVDQVLSTSTPSFLDSLRMKTFVLGTKPPRLEHVKTYPKADDDIVLMDWKFSFTPNDVSDLTARQIKNKINPKIVLEVRIGKGVISKGLDVIVEDMAFSGIMRVKFKLQIPFPHIEKVELCFLERPTIDYVCKPLGGDTFGFDINFIPGLESFIMDQIHANLAPMMYDPNVFPIEIAKILAGNPVDQAIGVLQVTFHGAQGLKNPDKFAGTPDPYTVVSINNRVELGRTKVVHENANPRWSETINVVITSLKDSLTLQVLDYNEYRKDKELGVATFPLEQLEEDPEHENQQLEVMANGRPRGIIQADIRFFPVLEGTKLEDGTQEPPPESMSGIAKFTVEQAKDLDGTKSLVGQLNPYAVLLLNGKEVQISQKLKRTNNPIWSDATKELLISDRKSAKLGLVIKDNRDMSTDPILGTYQIKLDDMLEMMAKERQWYNLAGAKQGRAKMMLEWKPVALKGALGGSGGYVTPIGVMRLHFQNARDLRNVETMGKSDPYVRVLLSGIEKGRTVTFKNNLNPDWDEVIYVPVHSTREKLLLEVMDQENVGKDRSLGHTELAVNEYVRQAENGEYLVNEQKSVLSEPLKSGPGNSQRGVLNFTCSFYPTENVYDPDDEEEEETGEPLVNGVGASEEVRPSAEGSRSSNDRARSRNGTISSLRPNSGGNDGQGNTSGEEGLAQQKEVPKIKLTADDLLQYECGLVVFKIISGEMAHTDCHVEVLMDDMLFPSYRSSKVRSKDVNFNETGDAMVREVEFSRMTLRLTEEADNKGENKENVIAQLSGNTIDTLRRCLYQPTQLSLKDSEGRESKITVSLKYLPVKMRLDPSESMNNQGTLRVEVLDAADLPAADRNGYSDPYCKFNLNGKEIYKTKTQKKTLHPAWNEFFETSVRSRTAANFEVVIYDYDIGGQADLLGKADINLSILEPFQTQEVTLGLDGKSGAIRLKLLFRPDYITRSRQGSSTFHGTFATPGKVVGAPVKSVGKGAVLIGGVATKGATFLGRTFKRRKSGVTEGGFDPVAAANGTPPLPGTPDTRSLQVETKDSSPTAVPPSVTPSTPHNRHRSWGARSMASATGDHSPSIAGAETGMASLTIVSASGYPPDTHLRVHVKLDGAGSKGSTKEVHKTKGVKAPAGEAQFAGEHDSVRVPCTADAQFRLVVKDHNTWGSDEELGEAVFFVDDQGIGGTEKEVRVGNGKVVLRSSFLSAGDGASVAPSGVGPPISPARTLRKSFVGSSRRDGRERSVTPGA